MPPAIPTHKSLKKNGAYISSLLGRNEKEIIIVYTNNHIPTLYTLYLIQFRSVFALPGAKMTAYTSSWASAKKKFYNMTTN
jgi:hypothetical protein